MKRSQRPDFACLAATMIKGTGTKMRYLLDKGDGVARDACHINFVEHKYANTRLSCGGLEVAYEKH